MSLPAKEDGVIELVKEEQALEQRAKALAEVNGAAAPIEGEATVVSDPTNESGPAAEPEPGEAKYTEGAVAADRGAVAPAGAKEAKSTEVATTTTRGAVAPTGAGAKEALAFLAEQGFEDVELDFTSFPIITLNNEVFSTTEHKNFGTKFEGIIMQKRESTLWRGELGRDKDPELIYSNDDLTDNKTGRPLAEFFADWKSRGIEYEGKQYSMLVVQIVDEANPHCGEVCQVQISPTSRGKLNGYLQQLAWKKILVSSVVTEFSVGSTIGTGSRAFNPFVFKNLGGAA